MKNRCSWANKEPLINYHDNLWGKAVFDNQELFLRLSLETMQAGLSWLTILNKRQNFLEAFDNFNPEIIINYDNKKIDSLMQNTGIIRNKLKILSVINNSKCYLKLSKTISFSNFLWQHLNHTPIKEGYENYKSIPVFTELSVNISKNLKKQGFKFVGPVCVMAFMQSVGMYNHHNNNCFLF